MTSEIIPFIVFECPIIVSSIAGTGDDATSEELSSFSIQALVFGDQQNAMGFGGFTNNSASVKVTNSKFISPN